MASDEINLVYERLKKEWPGLTLRQHAPRNRGTPDFRMIYEGLDITAEIKWISDKRPAKLSRMQALHLETLQKHGANAAVIAGYGRGRESRWILWKGEFIKLSKSPLKLGDPESYEITTGSLFPTLKSIFEKRERNA